MSQTALGDAVGVAFQQIQKYEKGDNRIGSSRLWDLSIVLGVPVSYFFLGLEPVACAGIEARSSSRADLERELNRMNLAAVIDAEIPKDLVYNLLRVAKGMNEHAAKLDRRVQREDQFAFRRPGQLS